MTTSSVFPVPTAWIGRQTTYPRDSSVIDLFEERVRETPDATVLVCGERRLTYAELDRRANSLAQRLREHGIDRGSLVAVLIERSAEAIMAFVAVLKAGAAYVPLDPSYPQSRLEFMLEDTAAAAVLTHGRTDAMSRRIGTQVIDVAECGTTYEKRDAPPRAGGGDDLAYVMYTSGSTGTPKGVCVPHRAIVRLVTGTDYARFWRDRVFLQLAPLSFDAATLEIWGPLLNGATCVVFPGAGLPDARALREVIRREHVTTMWLTASLFNAIIAAAPETLAGVEEILTGGEALSVSHIRRALEALPGTRLINGYGPTENTTFTCCHLIPQRLAADASSIPIGRPIPNTFVLVLRDDMTLTEVGEVGELYTGGDGLAIGYLNRPDLTATRFVDNPFADVPCRRLYRTGDRVRWLPDGTLDFIGRHDEQVKLHGFRIELGEVESAMLGHPDVGEAVAAVLETPSGDKQLAGYFTTTRESVDVDSIRRHLVAVLPQHMIPAVMLQIEHVPLTPNGKVNRDALPRPSAGRHQPEDSRPTAVERQVADIWSAVLGRSSIGTDENFFEAGGSSVLALVIVTQVERALGVRLSVVDLFKFPTIRKLAHYIGVAGERVTTPEVGSTGLAAGPGGPTAGTPSRFSSTERPDEPQQGARDVAIIGMAGRFPGARDLAILWQNLMSGVESTTRFEKHELHASIPAAERDDPRYVAARGILDDIELFDADFFSIGAREAEVMDPQQRVFIELAHEALESAGYFPGDPSQRVGVFAGCSPSSYYEAFVRRRPDVVEKVGPFKVMLANERDYLTTFASYKLDLTGPSVAVNTACSTSLVAIVHACDALREGRCDIALAGGVTITVPQNSGYLYQEGSMLSPDGRCRPFDADAQGTMFNNGAGIVVLKRLDRAVADRDNIIAVIKGVGSNNDGATKVSFTAPSVDGQASAVRMALTDAGIDADTIRYIETHGTATPLGDPIEIRALKQVFGESLEPPCTIGSIKGNIGHAVYAAGVAGVIKTALALQKGLLPPTANYRRANLELGLDQSRFHVTGEVEPWGRGPSPRRAGVSSFGVGGTNAHVIIEEAPPRSAPAPSRAWQPVLLSAKSETALAAMAERLRSHLATDLDACWADVCFTLACGRRSHRHRRFVVARDVAHAVQVLASPGTARSSPAVDGDTPVIFAFPGQGSQRVGMGATAYRHEPVFRRSFDECADLLRPHISRDLRDVVFPTDPAPDASAILDRTEFAQPALFSLGWALAQLWISWGVSPAAVIGHSVGEFVGACLAGVFTLQDALRVVAHRGRLMQALPNGAMLSVRLGVADVQPCLDGQVSIAAINGPSMCVVAGPTDRIAKLRSRWEAEGVVVRELRTSHAFHSPMMDAVVEPFCRIVQDSALSAARIPIMSTVTADWLTTEATDPAYWARHLRATVRFSEAARALWNHHERAVMLELGPHATVSVIARQQAVQPAHQIALPSLVTAGGSSDEIEALVETAAKLWSAGVPVDWRRFFEHEHRSRVPLPTYPFDRKRYFLDPDARSENEQAGLVAATRAAKETKNPVAVEGTPSAAETREVKTMSVVSTGASRVDTMISAVLEVLGDTFGADLNGADPSATFLELGFDSLFLTQACIALEKRFSVKLTFRQLLEELTTVKSVAGHIAEQTHGRVEDLEPIRPDCDASNTEPRPLHRAIARPDAAEETRASRSALAPAEIRNLFAEQLALMKRQLELLAGTVSPDSTEVENSVTADDSAPKTTETSPPASRERDATSGPASIEKQPKLVSVPSARADNRQLTAEQQDHLERLIGRYTERTAGSKLFTLHNRRRLADPRAVAGFRQPLKQLVYPIVVSRSRGSRLWDVDGNEYVDLINGFGANLLGHSSSIVLDAIQDQLTRGFEVGPQSDRVEEVVELVGKLTKMERVAFCNTGSEAILGAVRVARTVTGRKTIAIFCGSYHGIFDEVITRMGRNACAVPGAPGITPEAVANVLVLDYGSPASLALLRQKCGELAAVVVEPVQTSNVDLQPHDFLHELRKITEESGAALIVDEVVTGFRVAPGGAQQHFAITGDLATYGKVLGGGLPIGIVAGKRRFMDAFDGGAWTYEDESAPDAKVTYFAGTFVRHPLALASAAAILRHLDARGPELQRELNGRTTSFVSRLNDHFESVDAPLRIASFSSILNIRWMRDVPFGELLYVHLRERGVHFWDGQPGFLTVAHTDEDLERVFTAFCEAVEQLQQGGFIPRHQLATSSVFARADAPPVPGARLGRDPSGRAAWYIPDPERPGKYLQLAG